MRRELGLSLKSEGFGVVFSPKGISNGKLATFSKSESRVLITNDSDFASRGEGIFSYMVENPPERARVFIVAKLAKNIPVSPQVLRKRINYWASTDQAFNQLTYLGQRTISITLDDFILLYIMRTIVRVVIRDKRNGVDTLNL